MDITKEKQDFLEKLIDMYPFLEIEKQKIYDECIPPSNQDDENTTTDLSHSKSKYKHKKNTKKEEIVIEQFQHDGKLYYKDQHNGILDENANLVGVIRGVDDIGTEIYEFFDNGHGLTVEVTI